MSECIYAGCVEAKNGTPVPVFTNGRTFFSLYNPERDAENFIKAHKDTFDSSGFILIGGIGSGLHIKELLEKYDNVRIIAFEADVQSLEFSLNHLESGLQKFIGNKVNLTENELQDAFPEQRLFFSSMEDLRQTLLTCYIPSLYGNFSFAAVRSWIDMLGDKSTEIISLINNTISDISADYSVQAQFGKIWHRNILENITIYDTIPENLKFNNTAFSPGNRKAAIIGAGPSLDESIVFLRENRKDFCIFTTDTALGSLTSSDIIPDFVVTIDSQHISEQHFIGQKLENCVLACDLTANSSILRNALMQGSKILLFHNNHPLSFLIDTWLTEEKGITKSPFPFIESGAGTVLHAAADLARKLSFSELTFFGADFSYSDGKPYTKGTYLEKQYYPEGSRTYTAETAYNRLMFRTQLITLSNGSQTTDVLNRYRKSLHEYLDYECIGIIDYFTDFPVQIKDFIPWYTEKLHNKDKKVLFSLLPLAAWYKKNFSNADTKYVYAYAEQFPAYAGRIQCHLPKN